MLEPKKGAPSTARSKMLSAMHQQKTSTQLMVDDGHNWLLKMLTNEQAYEKSDELRFDDDEEKGDEEVVVAEVEAELGKDAFTELKSEIMKPRNFEKGATASEMAANPRLSPHISLYLPTSRAVEAEHVFMYSNQRSRRHASRRIPLQPLSPVARVSTLSRRETALPP